MANQEILPIQIEDTEISKDEGSDKNGAKKSRNETARVINVIIGGEVPKEKRMKRTRNEGNRLPDITFGPEDG